MNTLLLEEKTHTATRSLWHHPALNLQLPQDAENFDTPQSPKLYLVPTPHFFGEDDENQDQPQPSPLSLLPNVEEWMNRFTVTVIEIFAGKRSISQLNRWCHHRAFLQLSNLYKAILSKKTPAMKIRKIYISQPIDGVIESVVTLRIGERVRSMIIRCEGLDERWICTNIALL